MRDQQSIQCNSSLLIKKKTETHLGYSIRALDITGISMARPGTRRNLDPPVLRGYTRPSAQFINTKKLYSLTVLFGLTLSTANINTAGVLI